MATRQLWQWNGIDSTGALQHGAMWCEDRNAALQRLNQQQIHPLTLKRSPVRRSLWRAEQACTLLRQLATLLQAGLTLSASLQLLAQQHPARQWRALLQHLAQTLEQGESFSAALREWPDVFPPLWLAMIQTGELTGKLDECCFKLAIQQQAQRELAQKVKKALRYPLIILSLTAAIVLAMVYLVLPQFSAIYQTFNTPLPALTRGVIAGAALLQQGAVPLMIIGLMMAGAMTMMRRHTGWRRTQQRWLLRCPQMGRLIRGQRLSQIFTVLSLTQRAGITFLQGLESVKETMICPYWQEVLHQAHQQITQGSSISSALAGSGEFTSLCVQLIHTGEISGALDVMLENLAQHHSEQTQHQADGLAAVLEPLLLVVTGLIIGVLVVAMYLPIFHLGDAMGSTG
ncbi:protein transport protein HofC [Kosakonia sp.]|uniref:protein transport protein HofC n=1 Tax=Kosakonia sp. TaxID=1916651 RepID=UPI002898B2BE|nr:protein transport protein HofC [Kosakonia sp.]